jgi:hypothetical protein
MTELAWRILALFIEQTQHGYQGEWKRGYFAAWTLGEQLGGDATTIQGVTTKHHPRNAHEKALRELIDLGIVEELPNLGERFRLVVTDSHDEKEVKK